MTSLEEKLRKEQDRLEEEAWSAQIQARAQIKAEQAAVDAQIAAVDAQWQRFTLSQQAREARQVLESAALQEVLKTIWQTIKPVWTIRFLGIEWKIQRGFRPSSLKIYAPSRDNNGSGWFTVVMSLPKFSNLSSCCVALTAGVPQWNRNEPLPPLQLGVYHLVERQDYEGSSWKELQGTSHPNIDALTDHLAQAFAGNDWLDYVPNMTLLPFTTG